MPNPRTHRYLSHPRARQARAQGPFFYCTRHCKLYSARSIRSRRTHDRSHGRHLSNPPPTRAIRKSMCFHTIAHLCTAHYVISDFEDNPLCLGTNLGSHPALILDPTPAPTLAAILAPTVHTLCTYCFPRTARTTHTLTIHTTNHTTQHAGRASPGHRRCENMCLGNFSTPIVFIFVYCFPSEVNKNTRRAVTGKTCGVGGD